MKGKDLLKKVFLLAGFVFSVSGYSQQNFSTNMNASLVVGQPNFTSNNNTYGQGIALGPGYTAISSKGLLAVALLEGNGVFIWNSIPSTNGQLADVVVGNLDFNTRTTGPSQSETGRSGGVAFSPDGNRLIVSDSQNNRVLIWNSIPQVNGQPADLVLGQPNFTSSSAGTGAQSFNYPQGIYVSVDGRLFVADRFNHRVLIWNSIPTVNNVPADVVVGQTNFTNSGSGAANNRMNSPWGVWVSPDGKLLVGDEQNHRVLIFNQVPTTNGATANVIVGQTGTQGTAVNRLRQPIGASVSPDGKLFVGDFGNNRVLMFDAIPTSNGANADIVFGQPNFTSATLFNPAGNPSQNNMSRPYNVTTDLNGRLFVTGRDMNRILMYGSLPADIVDLGVAISGVTEAVCDGSQVSFTVSVSNAGATNATGVIATTALPHQFNYSAHELEAGTYNSASGYWNVGQVEPGQTRSLTIIGNVNLTTPTSLTAYANVVAVEQIDNNYSNNATNTTITVQSGTVPTGGTLTGPTESHQGFTVTYALEEVTNAVDYVWDITGATNVTGSGNARNITFGNDPVRIKVFAVSATCSGTVFTRNVSVTTPPDYVGEWVLFDTDFSDWCPGETRDIELSVKNTGTMTWLPSPDFNIAYWWNGQSAGDGLRIPVTSTVNAGQTYTVTASVTAPIVTGANNLTFDIEKVGDCFFGNNNGSCGPLNQLFVSPVITILNDNIAPVPDVASLPDILAECSVASLIAPTATDNCAGTVAATHNATLPITAQGTTVVTWTYDDGNGNTSTQLQNVIIDDVTAPVADAASLPDIIAECSVASLIAPTATDNCAGTVTATHNATLPITAQGTTVVTWTYDDGNGNTSTQLQNVIIDDDTAPVADAASLPDIIAECSVASLIAPTATDNCAGTVTATHNATLPITAQGTTVVTWTYDDGNGNTSTQLQNVIIDDDTAPVADAASLPDIIAECSVASLIAPTATDNCAGTVAATHNATLPITAQGTTVVTWTYDDGNGNTSTQLQNVIIDDVTAPVADAASLPDIIAECSVASLIAPTATDNCAGTVTATHNATLPITAQGTTVVTWTYDDGNGNTSTQLQNVIIDDDTAPVADAASLPDIIAECSVASLIAPTATDNCAGTVAATHNATLPITAQGTTVVTWTYDDGNGNTSTQLQNVIIDDVTAPVPDVASLSDILAECSIATLAAPTAIDNCAGTVTATHNATLPITAQGTTVVTWTYDDGNGNTSTQLQNVIIDDVTAPVPDVASLSDILAECSIATLAAPTAIDNCAGTVTATHNATLPITAQGTTVVNWTYDDGNGNTSTQLQNVIIDDVTAPVPDVASLSDIWAECSVATLIAPTATDNCAGTVTATHNATLPITAQGTTVVTWTYDDGNGNTSTQLQNVIIDDVTAPVPDVASLSDIWAECSIATLAAPTAIDNCAGTVTATHNATLPITAQGTTVVTWTYDDGNGNTSTQLQNVIIDDVTAPVPDVASLSDIWAECSVTIMTAPTATDNCAGSVTATHNITLPITAQGTTVVTWTYDDGNGNTSTQLQNVIIDDVIAPVPDVASLSDIWAECSIATLAAPTAIDNCAGTVTATHNATLPITAQGTTVVTWTYDDGNGNTSTQLQNVIIDDVTAPVPDVASLSDIWAECSIATLAAPTAIDNCAGTVTATHNATLPITAQGTTVVTWTYDDGNGNTSTQLQNVIIDDVTAPVPDVASLSDIWAECSVTIMTAPTATDNCAGSVTATHNITLPITAQGTTVVTWTYDDGNGNTSTQLQNVIIDDVTAPVPDVASLSDIWAECSVTIMTVPTATDNCAGSVTATHNITLPITAQGTTVVTWTYDDGNGNTSTQLQNVIIDDVTAPVPDVASLSDIWTECSVATLAAPTAIDNCAGTVTATHNATLPITAQGTTVVTWTYDDGNGNTSTQLQNVIIDDVIAPVINNCPADISVVANNANCTAIVSWEEPTANDNCSDLLVVGRSHEPGSVFVIGTTNVTYTFRDEAGNITKCNFAVTVNNSLEVTAEKGHVKCYGGNDGSITPFVSGGEGPYNFNWNNSEWTDENLYGLEAGVYDVIVMDSNQCEAFNIFEITEPDATSNEIKVEGATLTALESNADSYLWFDCNDPDRVLENADADTFIALEDGEYAVIIIKDGCQVVSDCVSVVLTNTEIHKFIISVIVSPNPVKGIATVLFGREVKDVKVSVFSASGGLVKEHRNISGSSCSVDFAGLNTGFYLIEIIDGNSVERIKVMKE
jgi:carbon monoxide dehydrogenase subunit G